MIHTMFLDLLTGLTDTTVYPTVPEQDASLPYVTYSEDCQPLDPVLNGKADLRQYNFTVDIVSKTKRECKSIEAALIDGLDGYRSLPIQGIFYSGRNEIENNEAELYYQCQLLFDVFCTTD